MKTEYLCNLIIPGAAKSGTSSLHEALGQHPQICMSKYKEPQFFSFSERYAEGSLRHNQFFENCTEAMYYGESSQCYFVHEHAIERIVDSLKDPKVIIILREPIKRLLSQYAWNYRRSTETSSLADALSERGETVEYIYDNRIKSYREIGGYITFSRYSRWVPLWQQRFGTNNVLVVRFEDFVSDQERVVSRCFDFLGLDRVPLSAKVKRNTTDQTVTKILPVGIKSLVRLVPGFLKGNGLYINAKQRFFAYLTPQPETTLNRDLHAFLETELVDDIAFYNKIERN